MHAAGGLPVFLRRGNVALSRMRDPTLCAKLGKRRLVPEGSHLMARHRFLSLTKKPLAASLPKGLLDLQRSPGEENLVELQNPPKPAI